MDDEVQGRHPLQELRWRADDAFVSLGLEHVTLKGDALQRATAIRPLQ